MKISPAQSQAPPWCAYQMFVNETIFENFCCLTATLAGSARASVSSATGGMNFASAAPLDQQYLVKTERTIQSPELQPK